MLLIFQKTFIFCQSKGPELVAERVSGKSYCILTTVRSRKAFHFALKKLHCFHHALYRLLLEKHTGWRLQFPESADCFEGSSLSKCHYRSATSLRLDRRDAEILLCSKKKCSGALHVIT